VLLSFKNQRKSDTSYNMADLEEIMCSEVNQSQRDKYTENRPVVARSGKEKGVGIEFQGFYFVFESGPLYAAQLASQAQACMCQPTG
jgi:hypothetical protein